MDRLPLPADSVEMMFKFIFDPRQFDPPETIILAQTHSSFPAMDLEHRFAAVTDHMQVCWSMVVDINHNSKTSNSQDRRHLEL